MSANLQTQRGNDAQNDGSVWYRLRSEREQICEALLKESRSVPKTPTESAELTKVASLSTEKWHGESLEARLSKVDEALDRLMAGSYGNCVKCGRWIEDTKLDVDPAIAYCCECWPRVQINH